MACLTASCGWQFQQGYRTMRFWRQSTHTLLWKDDRYFCQRKSGDMGQGDRTAFPVESCWPLRKLVTGSWRLIVFDSKDTKDLAVGVAFAFQMRRIRPGEGLHYITPIPFSLFRQLLGGYTHGATDQQDKDDDHISDTRQPSPATPQLHPALR
ncbi:hypothetical protein I7I51_05860 [Histoplasma capsulatum]|uniref:Uncharacterized protein n=1 Tax=Ajellomyces capsulatus TaxID=5037 RepID=A0A8A1M983_AJECA|nr:hypothetical protein I7I51_05860 [Histoplasma capsulatum]